MDHDFRITLPQLSPLSLGIIFWLREPEPQEPELEPLPEAGPAEPRALFLDEPTAGLDPEAAKLVRDFIAELKGEGRTIFMCTHNLDEADRLCDRIAVFNTRLRVVDTPAGLRQELYGRQVVFHLAQMAEPFVSTVNGLPYLKQVQAIDNKLVEI